MFRRVFTITLIVSLAVGFLAFIDTQTANAECIDLSGNGDQDRTFGPFQMPAGSSITAVMTAGDMQLDVIEEIPPNALRTVAASGGTAITFIVDGVMTIDSVKYEATHTVVETFDTDSEVYVYLNWQFNGDPANTYHVYSDDCAGCDQFMPIPNDAAGGLFISDAPVYYEPGQLVNPALTISAGSTYLVIGQDDSGQYRKVLLACQFVWVPMSTVVPNPDTPWFGVPLPMNVVD